MVRLIAAWAALTVGAAGSVAVGEPRERHAAGRVFLRLTGGLDLSHAGPAALPDGANQVEPGVGVFAAGGYGFARGWAVYVEPYEQLAFGSATVATQGLGLGVVRYVAGAISLSGSVGLARLQYLRGRDQPDTETNVGVGGALQVGRDWWLSPDWTVGLAARLGVVVTDEDRFGDVYDRRASSATLSLVLTRD